MVFPKDGASRTGGEKTPESWDALRPEVDFLPVEQTSTLPVKVSRIQSRKDYAGCVPVFGIETVARA